MSKEFRLSAGPYELVLTTAGGGIRRFTFEGRSLTETYPAGEVAPLSAGVMLFPWPNRIADGVFTFQGTTHQLAITEKARNTAIHGFAMHEDFTVDEDSVTDRSVTMRWRIDPDKYEGWSWPLELICEWDLHPELGLSCRMTVQNHGDTPAPFGLGVHTYLNAWDAPLDECVVDVPASSRYPMDSRCLPCGPLQAVTADDDLRDREVAGRWVDYPYTDMVVDEDSFITYLLTNKDGNGVALSVQSLFNWAQVYTADPKNNEAYPGRGRAIAVEPMTCPPNAFRTGEDVMALQPQGVWSADLQMYAVCACDDE